MLKFFELALSKSEYKVHSSFPHSVAKANFSPYQRCGDRLFRLQYVCSEGSKRKSWAAEPHEERFEEISVVKGW